MSVANLSPFVHRSLWFVRPPVLPANPRRPSPFGPRPACYRSPAGFCVTASPCGVLASWSAPRILRSKSSLASSLRALHSSLTPHSRQLACYGKMAGAGMGFAPLDIVKLLARATAEVAVGLSTLDLVSKLTGWLSCTYAPFRERTQLTLSFSRLLALELLPADLQPHRRPRSRRSLACASLAVAVWRYRTSRGNVFDGCAVDAEILGNVSASLLALSPWKALTVLCNTDGSSPATCTSFSPNHKSNWGDLT